MSAATRNPSRTDLAPQWRRGVLELCVLKLLLADGASYGYEIVTTLNTLGPLAAGENTIYPLLRRLKADGQLDTFMADSPAGPPRQYYQLTPEGQARLTVLEREWTEVVQAVDTCLRRGVAA